LWILLLIFLADRKYAEITEEEFFADGHTQPLLGLSAICDGEVSRILLNSAIALRVMDDRDGVLARLGNCGEWRRDVVSDRTEQLQLREACNKIVHAEQVNFDIERLDGGAIDRPGLSPSYMTPIVYLYGTHRQVQWRCALDIVAYVRAASGALS
jgi:hypothetical protein